MERDMVRKKNSKTLIIPSDSDNITDLKKQIVEIQKERDAYKKQSYQLEQIFNHTIPLCMTDKDFNVISVNKAYAKMIEKTTEQCIGNKCYDNAPGDKCHTSKCPLTLILNDGKEKVKCEYCKKRDEADETHYLVTTKPYYDIKGNLAGIIESFMDITERKQLENKVSEQERFLHTILDTIQDYISVVTPDLKIIKVNKALQTLFPNQEIIGEKCYEVYHNRKKRCKECAVKKSIKAKKLVKSETKYIDTDNKTVMIEHFAFPMLDADGNVIAVVEYVRNITKRKNAEKKQNTLIKKLNKAISEIKTLKGILPLCSYCKKIRDDKGYWEQVDTYIHENTDADISHGICPDCLKAHFPSHYEEIKNDKTSKVKLK